MIVFDIETGPLDEDTIRANIPAFDADNVAIGNRGPDKAAEYIAKKAAEHEIKFIERAALSALTGRVLAVGCMATDSGKVKIVSNDDNEAAILTAWWTLYRKCAADAKTLVGFNCRQFDMPFLIRRSWLLGVSIPVEFLHYGIRDRTYTDLLDLWQLGNHQDYISLDRLGRLLGCGGKLEDNGEPMNGADFHLVWDEDREKAIAYLTRDLELTAAIAAKLGVV